MEQYTALCRSVFRPASRIDGSSSNEMEVVTALSSANCPGAPRNRRASWERQDDRFSQLSQKYGYVLLMLAPHVLCSVLQPLAWWTIGPIHNFNKAWKKCDFYCCSRIHSAPIYLLTGVEFECRKKGAKENMYRAINSRGKGCMMEHSNMLVVSESADFCYWFVNNRIFSPISSWPAGKSWQYSILTIVNIAMRVEHFILQEKC